VIDDRLRAELGPGYERHSANSVGADKLTVVFFLRAGFFFFLEAGFFLAMRQSLSGLAPSTTDLRREP